MILAHVEVAKNTRNVVGKINKKYNIKLNYIIKGVLLLGTLL